MPKGQQGQKRSGGSIGAVVVVEKIAQAEAGRYFAARGARAVPGRAKEVLARSGAANPPRDDDRLE